jgi:hypothetical protein
MATATMMMYFFMVLSVWLVLGDTRNTGDGGSAACLPPIPRMGRIGGFRLSG